MRLPFLAAALAAVPLAASAQGPVPANPPTMRVAGDPSLDGRVASDTDLAPTAILVTGAREPVSALLSGEAATVIDAATIKALQLPQATDYLRLIPGVAIATSGPLGEQTQVRIRGAEANHTLVFVDGIVSNDPASSGEFLFQTLPADGLARIEVLRGPQSALWGSEAIGGVISVTTPAPVAGASASARIEGGSLGTYRAAAAANLGTAATALAATASYVATDGIAISGRPGGLRNGFDNLFLTLKGVVHPAPGGELGAVVHYADATTRFDDTGDDGLPRDARNASTNRALGVRGWADAHPFGDALDAHIEASWTDSDNLNRVERAFTNSTAATRLRFVGQMAGHWTTGALTHRLTGAAEYEEQVFTARDTATGPLSITQRARREQTSGIGEYRIEWAARAAASVSVRRDLNSGFANATTVRAAGAAQLGRGVGLHGSYSEGITNPNFTEQFGYFPGAFVGNPNLRPERAQGFDAGAGWRRAAASVDVTYFRTDLRSEIVTVFTPAFLATPANALGRSHRQGVEVSIEARPLSWLRAAASYTYLDATQPDVGAGAQVREARRPEHSGSVTLTAEHRRGTFAFTTAYVGDRGDTRFYGYPDYQSVPVTLRAYWLASVAGSLSVGHGVELTGRVENAFDQRYQDVFGYTTPGVTAYGGVRARFR